VIKYILVHLSNLHSSSAALWTLFCLSGVFNAEFVLSSVMRQEINYGAKTTLWMELGEYVNCVYLRQYSNCTLLITFYTCYKYPVDCFDDGSFFNVQNWHWAVSHIWERRSSCCSRSNGCKRYGSVGVTSITNVMCTANYMPLYTYIKLFHDGSDKAMVHTGTEFGSWQV